MFCSGCGQAVVPGQQVCGHCGRVVPPQIYAYPYQRVHRHVQTLGLLWIAYAVYSAAGWLIALPFLTGMFGGFHHHYWGPWGGHDFFFPHLMWLTPLISTVAFARVALALITGLGLMRRAPWARTLAIVAGFLTLIKPVLGTALGIYTLWVMLPAASGNEYQGMATP
jgi:hypothetical protein